MPDLESMIDDWRRGMADGGLRDPEVIEELEGHLREDIAVRMTAGADAAGAFHASAARLGETEALRAEFIKLGGAPLRRFRSAWLTLAGIPPFFQPSTIPMTHAPTSTEPRWATYTRAALFLSPAVLLSTFAFMYLTPKLEAICRQAGVKLPGIYHASVSAADHHVVVLLLCAILPLALLEWRWSRWPMFRRATLGSAVFLFNAAVLALLATMLVFALLAAPHLAAHAP